MKWPVKYIVILVVLALAAFTVISFISDPFGVRSFFERNVKAQRDLARGDAANLRTASEADAVTTQRVETFHREEVVIRDLTTQAQTEARNAPDADTPLSDERANRLRSADDSLCERAAICTAAAPDASAGRPPAV